MCSNLIENWSCFVVVRFRSLGVSSQACSVISEHCVLEYAYFLQYQQGNRIISLLMKQLDPLGVQKTLALQTYREPVLARSLDCRSPPNHRNHRIRFNLMILCHRLLGQWRVGMAGCS
jgi:hypothetical protein